MFLILLGKTGGLWKIILLKGEIVSLVLHIIPSWLCPLDLFLSRRSDEGVYLQERLAPAFLPSSHISINL